VGAESNMLRVEKGSSKGARLITERAFGAGEVIGKLEGYRVSNTPTYLSVQVGPETHIEGLGQFDYLNHACAPTTVVDTERLEVRAARDLQPGEELTFFYPSSEWVMAQPFTCLCGASGCLGMVSGARDLPRDVLERYHLTPHIRELLDKRSIRAASKGLSGPGALDAHTLAGDAADPASS
jgi:hypothetical protein